MHGFGHKLKLESSACAVTDAIAFPKQYDMTMVPVLVTSVSCFVGQTLNLVDKSMKCSCYSVW